MARTTLRISILCSAILGLPALASAEPPFPTAWLGQYPSSCPDLVAAANDCSLCHSTGANLNPYGAALQSTIPMDGALPDFLAVEPLDSDSDGVTNLQEINNCTRPGGEPTGPGGEGDVPREDGDGNFVLDVGGDVSMQLLFSQAGFRNQFVVVEPVSTDPSVFDTDICTVCPLVGGDVSCACQQGLTEVIGTFPAGTVFRTAIQVDRDRDGTIDDVFFSDAASNPDAFDHLRTFNIGPGVWRLEWEDIFGGGDRDFNDLVVMIFSRPVTSSLGEADWRGTADLRQFRYLNNITVDPQTIPPNQRKLRLTQVITNFGDAVDAAFCAMLNFSGTRRPNQGYTYKRINNAGDLSSVLDGIPDCNGAADREPSVRLTLDQMQSSPGQCPSSPPPTLPIRISKVGNRHLRAALFLPAMVASQHEPRVRALYEKLLAKGKKPMQALVAVMRKRLHAIHGRFLHDADFDGTKFFAERT